MKLKGSGVERVTRSNVSSYTEARSGAEGYEDSDDHDPELDARDTAFDVGGGSRGGIGGVGQLGDNLATGPVPDLTVPEDTELHELDDQGEPAVYGSPDGPEAGPTCRKLTGRGGSGDAPATGAPRAAASTTSTAAVAALPKTGGP